MNLSSHLPWSGHPWKQLLSLWSPSWRLLSNNRSTTWHQVCRKQSNRNQGERIEMQSRTAAVCCSHNFLFLFCNQRNSGRHNLQKWWLWTGLQIIGDQRYSLCSSSGGANIPRGSEILVLLHETHHRFHRVHESERLREWQA